MICKSIIVQDVSPVNPCYNIGLGQFGQPILDYRTATYDERLAVGEWYEDYVCKLLQSEGIQSDRYRQDFDQIPKPKRYRLLQQYQRDCYIQLPGIRLNLEVKSRNSPFIHSEVVVGKRKSWDSKRFETHFLAVVDQDWLTVRFTLADRKTRSERWIEMSNNDDCYGVRLLHFMELDKVVSLLKRGKVPNSHWRSRQANLLETIR